MSRFGTYYTFFKRKVDGMKILLVSLIFISMCTIVYGQDKLPSMDYIPQSPAAAAYSRYGEIPVDHSTGVPRIEIPIHTIKVGDVEVPITISYHSSGIKVRDVASEVGLGFVLNTGGVVTAQIIGKNDMHNLKPNHHYKSASDIHDSITNAHLSGDKERMFRLAEDYWRILTQVPHLYDHFSDRFYYSLITGESGNFRKDYVSDAIRLMPYRPVKVELNYPNINITASNGYKHYFKDHFLSWDYYVLDKVVSENSTDSLLFHYRSNYHSQLNVNYFVSWQNEEPYIEDNVMICGTDPCLSKRPVCQSDPGGDGGLNSRQTPLLDSIITKNEIVYFDYIRDRRDNDVALTGDRLARISIKNKLSGETIKVVKFSHSYFGTESDDNLRLRLDSVLVSGLANEVVERYFFGYNTSIVLPPYPRINGLYGENIWYEDYWGYYNRGPKNNLFPTFINDFNICNLPSYARPGSMEADGFAAMACILTEIKYPTGGKTIFEYEPNAASGYYYHDGGGGVRISKITSYSNKNSEPLVKAYKYGGVFSGAILPEYYTYNYGYPEDHCLNYKDFGRLRWDTVHYDVYKAFSTPLRSIAVGYGPPVIYTNITEYIGDESTNIGKNIYRYSPPEYPESRYPLPGDIDARYISYYHSDVGNYIPKLTNKTSYKYENGNYDKVRSEDYIYKKVEQREFVSGISFASKVVLEVWGAADLIGALRLYDDEYTTPNEYLLSLVYIDTKAFEDVSLLKESVIKDYIDTEKIVETTTTGYFADMVPVISVI